jgi:histidinol-phosphatase (PHP family)
MTAQNLHTHTIYDDGKNTPAQMAQGALQAGLTSLGFSGHSILPYPNDWSMTEETFVAYTRDVAQVREKFSGRLAIYYGLEWDLTSPQSPEGFDYVIGSIHHLPQGSKYPSVDESADCTRDILARYFDRNEVAMAQAYYAQYEALAAVPQVDIVGHIDLITKFSQTDGLFFTEPPAYRDAAVAAVEVLLKKDKLFEINTGAMSRGYRTRPYPAVWLLKELKARKARLVLTADAHAADAVAYGFSEAETLLQDLGFHELWEYAPLGFQPRLL